jgi:hypothetical protein
MRGGRVRGGPSWRGRCGGGGSKEGGASQRGRIRGRVRGVDEDCCGPDTIRHSTGCY